jgi:hypothetical protein
LISAGVLTRWSGRCALQSHNRQESVKGLPLGKYPWRRHYQIVSIEDFHQVDLSKEILIDGQVLTSTSKSYRRHHLLQ